MAVTETLISPLQTDETSCCTNVSKVIFALGTSSLNTIAWSDLQTFLRDFLFEGHQNINKKFSAVTAFLMILTPFSPFLQTRTKEIWLPCDSVAAVEN